MAACQHQLQVLVACAFLASTGFSIRVREGNGNGLRTREDQVTSMPGLPSCRADLQVGHINMLWFDEKKLLGDECPELFKNGMTQYPSAPLPTYSDVAWSSTQRELWYYLTNSLPLRPQDRATEPLPKELSLAECPVFYFHTKNYEAQGDVRSKNVESMTKMDNSTRVMSPIYWKSHAQLMYDAYAKLQLPVCPYVKDLKYGKCSGALPHGQYGRWLSQVVAAAYQVKFGLKCMVTMEDDIALPREFRDHLSRFAIEQDKPRIWRMGYWGEGLALNLAGAREFIERLYRHGIFTENDQFIHHFLKDMDSQINVGITALVGTNEGSIMFTNFPDASKFDYTSSVNSKPMEKLMNAFNSENDLDMVDVLARFVHDEDRQL